MKCEKHVWFKVLDSNGNVQSFVCHCSLDFKDYIKTLESTVKLLEKKLNIAVDALTWYAEGWHYRKTEDDDVEIDTGEHAQEALNRIDEIGQSK